MFRDKERERRDREREGERERWRERDRQTETERSIGRHNTQKWGRNILLSWLDFKHHTCSCYTMLFTNTANIALGYLFRLFVFAKKLFVFNFNLHRNVLSLVSFS